MKSNVGFGDLVYVVDNSYSVSQDGTGVGPTFLKPNLFILLQVGVTDGSIPAGDSKNGKINDTVIYHEATRRLYYIYHDFLRVVSASHEQ